MSVVDIIGEETFREVLSEIDAELRQRLPPDEKALILRQKKIVSRLYRKKLRKEKKNRRKTRQTLV
jgi:hypothetical protein